MELPTYQNLSRKKIALNIFVFVIAAYLVTASGLTLSDVGSLRVEVLQAIIGKGDVSVSADSGMLGNDGRYYSWFGIGSVLTAMPFYLVAKATGTAPEFAITIMNQLASALTVVVIFFFCSNLGFSNKASVITALLYGFGTIAWLYSKDSGDHALETLFILLAIYFSFLQCRSEKLTELVLSAVSFGMALLIRPTSILALGALFVLIFYPLRTKDEIIIAAKKGFVFLIIVIPFLALIFWYDYIRFGSVFETGHRLMASRLGIDYFGGTPALTGLYGLIASPGKGFFYYSPVALLFFFAIRPFSKKQPILSYSFTLLMLSFLVFYSKNVYWHGANGWGPRYIFAISPFFIIPLADIFDSQKWYKKRSIRGAVYLLFFISIIIQIASVTVNHNKYIVYLKSDKHLNFKVKEAFGVQPIIEPPPGIYWAWSLSPILTQFEFISKMTVDMKDYKYEPSLNVSTNIGPQLWMKYFDFWWVYAYFLSGSRVGFLVVLILMILTGASARRLLCILA